MEKIIYGEGGYDPSKPNNNVVSVEEIPDAPEDTARATALAKLAKLGLTVEDIQAVL